MEPLMSSSPPVDLWPGTKEGVMRAPLLASRCSDPAACCFPSSPPSAREPRLEEENVLGSFPVEAMHFSRLAVEEGGAAALASDEADAVSSSPFLCRVGGARRGSLRVAPPPAARPRRPPARCSYASWAAAGGGARPPLLPPPLLPPPHACSSSPTAVASPVAGR
uniref:Uncharacterized protein n=1 Tax=Oryza nivara TaxID=4536 RepID=A0A0E0H937_ORYNI